MPVLSPRQNTLFALWHTRCMANRAGLRTVAISGLRRWIVTAIFSESKQLPIAATSVLLIGFTVFIVATTVGGARLQRQRNHASE